MVHCRFPPDHALQRTVRLVYIHTANPQTVRQGLSLSQWINKTGLTKRLFLFAKYNGIETGYMFCNQFCLSVLWYRSMNPRFSVLKPVICNGLFNIYLPDASKNDYDHLFTQINGCLQRQCHVLDTGASRNPSHLANLAEHSKTIALDYY